MDKLPLAGLRVLEASWLVAMPYATSLLADLGAEVIKIEACHLLDTRGAGPFPDNDPGQIFWNRSVMHQLLNRNKLSVTLDLSQPEGIACFKDLVVVSDIVVESNTPRVMDQFGLNYACLRELRPDIIMLSNTGYGQTGPWRNYRAMAPALEAMYGIANFTGYEGGPPSKIGNAYIDFLAAWTAIFALLAAVIHRAQTGQGQWIDSSMYQIGTSFIGEGLLDYAFNKRNGGRIGQNHPYMAPHGCYECQTHEQWLTIAIYSDDQWAGLCDAMERQDLKIHPDFSDFHGRHRHRDHLDSIIEQWIRQQDRNKVMELLQRRGVPCGPVLNIKNLLADEQLNFRKFFKPITYPVESALGTQPIMRMPWKFTNIPLGKPKPAPNLGENNIDTLSNLLGMKLDDVVVLNQKGVIGTDIRAHDPPLPMSLDELRDLGWIHDYDPDYREELGAQE